MNDLPLYYPRAMRCSGDIVRLLWFRLSDCAYIRPSVHGPCEHNRDYTVVYLFIKLGRCVHHDERMDPIHFGGLQRVVVGI